MHDLGDSVVSAEAPEVVLAVREPFDAAGLFRWMAARAVPGMERVTESTYSRTLRLSSGPAWFELLYDLDATIRASGRLRLRARLTELSDHEELVSRVRRLFDLDADPQTVDGALARHPEIAPLVVRIPGIRVPGAIDPHEMLIKALIGQQISVSAARTAVARLVHALGEPVTAPDGETQFLFPTMSAIAEHGHEVLRAPAARIRAVTQIASALADGSLALGFDDDGVEQRARLLVRQGIGPWTADYVRMRVLGDPDVLLPGDSAMRAGAGRVGIPADARALESWATRAAPWRSYLTAHLWRAAAPTVDSVEASPVAVTE